MQTRCQAFQLSNYLIYIFIFFGCQHQSQVLAHTQVCDHQGGGARDQGVQDGGERGGGEHGEGDGHRVDCGEVKGERVGGDQHDRGVQDGGGEHDERVSVSDADGHQVDGGGRWRSAR